MDLASPSSSAQGSACDLRRRCLTVRSAPACRASCGVSRARLSTSVAIAVRDRLDASFSPARAASACRPRAELLDDLDDRLRLLVADTTAPSMSVLGQLAAPPSTMMHVVRVPATTMSMSVFLELRRRRHSSTYWPSTGPRATPTIGPLNGMSESSSAADAPISASTSASFSGPTT